MLWQPKRILGWTFITVLAINCHREVRRKPKKIYSTTNQTAKTKDELWTINSMALFNEFPRPISSTHDTTEKAQLPKTYDTIRGLFSIMPLVKKRLSWASCCCCCWSSVTLITTMWIWSPVQFALKSNQTKPAKGFQQQKVPKPKQCNSEVLMTQLWSM